MIRVGEKGATVKRRLIKLFLETHINDLESALALARERMPNSAKKERVSKHTYKASEAEPCKRFLIGVCGEPDHYEMVPEGEYRAIEPLRAEIAKLREDFETLFDEQES